MDDETLADWHDAASLRAAWSSLPAEVTDPGDIGYDLLYSAISMCKRHLLAQGLTVPAAGEVSADHRLAQVYFARSLGATRVSNEEAAVVGTAGFEIPAFNFEAKARRLLGYGSMGLG